MRSAGGKVRIEDVERNFPTPEALLEGWRLPPTHLRKLPEPKASRTALAVTTRGGTFFACR